MVADPKLYEFLCPLCGSNLALFVHVDGRSGNPVRMPFYQCAGCTVQFGSIERFKKQMRHTVSADHLRVDERPLRPEDRPPAPYWTPVEKGKKD